MRTVIARALEQTGNAGQPPDNWELRDAAGALLSLDQKIADFSFPPDVRLFLNLKAGVGGAVIPDQFVDPQVSRAKFDRELTEYRQLEADYRRRGWLLVRAEFPSVHVVLATPQLTPPAIVTGVAFDYTNYDMRPPSVRLVDPFTAEPYKAKELPTHLKRSVETGGPPIQGLQLPLGAQARFIAQQPLMQWYGPDDIPFLCIAGVREYHDHPGHSGDVWELHRRSGAGRCVRLLETIAKYGVQPISDYQVSLQPRISGFVQREVPS